LAWHCGELGAGSPTELKPPTLPSHLLPAQHVGCDGCFTWGLAEGQKGEGEVNATDSGNRGKELRLKLPKPLARRGGTFCTEGTLAVNLERCPSATRSRHRSAC